jgi:hypothetical protein
MNEKKVIKLKSSCARNKERNLMRGVCHLLCERIKHFEFKNVRHEDDEQVEYPLVE